MSRIRPTPHHGTPRTSRRSAAEKPDDYLALVNSTDCCEWCCRLRALSDHHVAQGFRHKTLYDIKLILRLCSECHRDIHKMCAEDGKALGLALVYHAGRGDNREHFWRVTCRKWPTNELVSLWIVRVGRTGKREVWAY